MRYSIIFTFVLLLGNLSFAQNVDWRVTLAVGQIINDVALKELSGDSLAVVRNGKTQWIPVQSIIEIRLVRKTTFWQGAKIGGIIGSIAGILHGAINVKVPLDMAETQAEIVLFKMIIVSVTGFLGAVYGGLVGGMIGSLAGIDEVYDLSQMNPASKLNLLHKALLRDRQRMPVNL